MDLLGPVFRYDLITLARRKRYFVLRVCFAVLLFGWLALSYYRFQRTLAESTQGI